MAKSSAERQAAFRQRKQERLNECITPDDVRRCVRLIYDQHAADPLNRAEPFEVWAKQQGKKRGGGDWMGCVPESGDIKYYADNFTPEEAALLAKVGAVFVAMRGPPEE